MFHWSLVRPDAIDVWKNNEIKRRLKWYYEVMIDKKPAKFLIAKRIPLDANPKEFGEDELWNLHDKLSKDFKKIFNEINNETLKLNELSEPKYSYLDVKIELAKRLLTPCRLCERRCKVNRMKESKGFCKLGYDSYVASYFLHMGEEAPLVPSGTIFFSGCSFRCVFCQNWDISQYSHAGSKVTPEMLASIAAELRLKGARNINYVGGNPDQHLHTIIESFEYLEINVPLLWNNNAYTSLEGMKLLLDIIDIHLPDLKYGNDLCAARLSAVPKYFEIATRNIKMVCENNDPVIIRHLVLPNHIECCTRPVLKWISENCPNALVNVMDQYRPEFIVANNPERYPEISRRLNKQEINRAYFMAREFNLLYEPIS
ncbi:MAG: radical SAM protein [Thermoprotei archaeon]